MPLHRKATQTVFGAGLKRVEVMLVGEQPGDREDVEGEPFVGPAGRVLDEALSNVGIERSELYLTNAVKHFKWEARASAASTSGRARWRWPPAGPGSRPRSRS